MTPLCSAQAIEVRLWGVSPAEGVSQHDVTAKLQELLMVDCIPGCQLAVIKSGVNKPGEIIRVSR